ncbi:256_t:CDS:1, partial [Racocetra fulgida]
KTVYIIAETKGFQTFLQFFVLLGAEILKSMLFKISYYIASNNNDYNEDINNISYNELTYIKDFEYFKNFINDVDLSYIGTTILVVIS